MLVVFIGNEDEGKEWIISFISEDKGIPVLLGDWDLDMKDHLLHLQMDILVVEVGNEYEGLLVLDYGSRKLWILFWEYTSRAIWWIFLWGFYGKDI